MTTKSNSVRPAAWRAGVLSLLIFAAAVPTVRAAADANPPDRMTYQGFLVDANGNALGTNAPKNYDVVFRIYDDQSAGNNLWAEQQTLTVDKGYFSVLLGEGSQYGSEARPALSTLFTNATASDRFVQITVKGIGPGSPPGDSTILPRLRLLTSPYAFLAQRAVNAVNLQGTSSTASGLTLNGLTTVSNLSVTGNLVLDANGQNTGSVSRVAVTFGGSSGEGIASKRNAGGNQNGLDFYTASLPRLSIDNGGNVGILGTKVLEFGRGIAGKDGNAGKIGYNTFTADALDIVGAGTNGGNNRKIKLWCEGGVTANGTVTAPAFSGNGTIPVGGIIMWSGGTNSIPSGWALCNGQTVNNQLTPDLRDRFIVGVGNSYTNKATGGSQNVTLSVPNLPAHNHTYTDYFFRERNNNWSSGGTHTPGDGTGDNQSTTRTTDNTGSGQAFDIRPPYYALAYIMRVY